jgi:hypothetical protein
MTNSEKITSMISKKFFLEQYCYNEIYVREDNSEKEFCDCLIEFNNVYIVIQIKERSSIATSSEEDWFENKVVKKAKKQLKDTYQYFQNVNCEIFSKKSDLIIDRTKLLIPMIVFLNNEMYEYRKVITSRSLQTDINVFNYQDFKIMLETVILPHDILRYLQYRLCFKDSDISKLLFDEIDDSSTMLGCPSTENDYAEWFLSRTYYKDVMENKLSEENIAFYHSLVCEINEAIGHKRNNFISGFLCVDYVRSDKIVRNWKKCIEFSKNDVYSLPFQFTLDNVAYLFLPRLISMSDEEFERYVECQAIYFKYKNNNMHIAYIISPKYLSPKICSIDIIDVNLNQLENYDNLLQEVIAAFEK